MRALLGFDPADHHVVMRPFVYNGVHLAPGDPVPSQMGERRMRQFFEMRKIGRPPKPKEEASGPPQKGKK